MILVLLNFNEQSKVECSAVQCGATRCDAMDRASGGRHQGLASRWLFCHTFHYHHHSHEPFSLHTQCCCGTISPIDLVAWLLYSQSIHTQLINSTDARLLPPVDRGFSDYACGWDREEWCLYTGQGEREEACSSMRRLSLGIEDRVN